MRLKIILITLVILSVSLITLLPLDVKCQGSVNLKVFISDHCGKNPPSGPQLKVIIVGGNDTTHTYQHLPKYNDTHTLLNVTLPIGNYTIRVEWMGVLVASTTVNLVNDTSIAILTNTTLVRLRVEDYSGRRRIGEAELRLMMVERRIGAYTTDSKGEVRLLLPYGNYVVEEVVWQGRSILENYYFSVDGSKCTLTVDLRCRLGNLKILVTDEHGTPLEREKVSVKLLKGAQVVAGPIQPTEYGYAIFDLVPFDYYTAIVSFKVYWNGEYSELEVSRQSIELSEEALGDKEYVEVHISVPLVRNVEVRITDSEGQLLDNVELRRLAGHYVGRPAIRGVVRFSCLLRGSYTYEISWSSDIWGLKTFKGTINIIENIVDIRLPLYTLRVNIEGHRCPDISEFSIKLYDENWRYIDDSPPFRRLIEGTYYLEVIWCSKELGNITLIKEMIYVKESHTFTLKHDFYSISLRVVDPSGQPISNSTVNVKLPNGRILTLETGHEGRTEYVLLPKGSYPLTVNYKGVIIHEETIEVTTDGVIPLIGVVQDLIIKVTNFLGSAIQGARVKLMIALADGTFKDVAEKYTDASGIVVFKCIPRYARAEKYYLIIEYLGREYRFSKPFLADEITVEWKVPLDIVLTVLGTPLSLFEFLLIVGTCAVITITILLVILKLKRKREFETIFEEYARRRGKPRRRLIPWKKEEW